MAQPLPAPDSTSGTLLPAAPLSPDCIPARDSFPQVQDSVSVPAEFCEVPAGPSLQHSPWAPVCCHCEPKSLLCHPPQVIATDAEQGRARPESCRPHGSPTGHQVQDDPLTTTLRGQLSNWFFLPPSCPPSQILTAELRHKATAGKSVRSFADQYNQGLYNITN